MCWCVCHHGWLIAPKQKSLSSISSGSLWAQPQSQPGVAMGAHTWAVCPSLLGTPFWWQCNTHPANTNEPGTREAFGHSLREHLLLIFVLFCKDNGSKIWEEKKRWQLFFFLSPSSLPSETPLPNSENQGPVAQNCWEMLWNNSAVRTHNCVQLCFPQRKTQ